MKKTVLALTMGASLLFASGSFAEDKKVIDEKFIATSAYLVGSTIFDVETTFAAINNGAIEANPIMKPFIKNGRLATYGVQLGLDAAIIYASYKMKESSKFGRVWWVAPMFIGTSHTVCGGLNLRLIW